MTELRWILLAIGAVAIIAVWLYARFSRPKRTPLGENLMDAIDPPELNDVLEPGLSAAEIEALGRGLQREVREDGTPELIISMHVARTTAPITGAELFPAMVEAGLAFGRMDIFHHDEVFAVANMVEPGTFNPLDPDSLVTPGVSLFAVLPGPLAGAATLERMLSCARNLADALDADVLDEGRSVFTRQTEQHLRERIASFELRARQHGRP